MIWLIPICHDKVRGANESLHAHWCWRRDLFLFWGETNYGKNMKRGNKNMMCAKLGQNCMTFCGSKVYSFTGRTNPGTVTYKTTLYYTWEIWGADRLTNNTYLTRPNSEPMVSTHSKDTGFTTDRLYNKTTDGVSWSLTTSSKTKHRHFSYTIYHGQVV